MTVKGTPPAGSIRLDQIGDRYTVEREIGRGGMATVYLCTDARNGGKVAVKVLRPELGSAVVVERFLREIAFASELDHPQIPKVLDSGVVGELPYYVMNYIDGESLRARLDREKQLPIEEAIRIAQEVVKPTAYAHAHGIVHRDIKPGNILISSDRVYVLDFGVARAIMASADESLTSTGVAVGTPAYMSPEQALADHHIDARSDIYSLGCVVYEMIAGIPPFMGATAQAVMSRRFIAPPPPLHEARESVSPAVEGAVMKALTKSVADRWQRVEDFGDALAGRIGSPSLQAEDAVLRRKRRLYGRIVLAALTVAVAGGAAAVWSSSSHDYVSTGRGALERWDLTTAEIELRKAVSEDPDDPSANLWIAQLLALKGRPSAEWASFILRASDFRSRLSSPDTQRADVLTVLRNESNPGRCDQLRAFARRSYADYPSDYSATIFLGDCLRSDRRVTADSASPSGFSFASSYHEAAQLYEGVLERNAGNGAVYRVIMPRLEQVWSTNKNKLRGGILSGEVERAFAATPELIADTLAFVPYPVLGNKAALRSDPDKTARMVSRHREKLKRHATEWTRADPRDPDGQEMLARILESGGQLDGSVPSALATLAAARAAARVRTSDPETPLRNLRLASANVRVLLKLGRFSEASSLADTALSFEPTRTENDAEAEIDALRTGLLGLTGRLSQVIEVDQRGAADYSVLLPTGEVKLTAELGGDVQRLSDYAAFGAPRDSILSIYERLFRNLESFIPSAQLSTFRSAVLARPMSLAVDVTASEPLARLGSSPDPFIGAVVALHRGERGAARRLADSLTASRAGSAPGEVTMDAVFQNAWLLDALGDSDRAAATLDRALRGLSRTPPNLLSGATLAAILVRAMIFRANLANDAGDAATYRKWSEAANALWGRGDPEVRAKLPQLRR